MLTQHWKFPHVDKHSNNQPPFAYFPTRYLDAFPPLFFLFGTIIRRLVLSTANHQFHLRLDCFKGWSLIKSEGWYQRCHEFQGRRGWARSSQALSPHRKLVPDGLPAIQHYGILRADHPRQLRLRPPMRPHRCSGSHSVRLHRNCTVFSTSVMLISILMSFWIHWLSL